METTFENVKVGDKVWSIENGWGKVIELVRDSSYPVYVNFPICGRCSYTYGGCQSSTAQQTLFWNEIKFEVPTRPKRKVKKEVWANVYGVSGDNYLVMGKYGTKEKAYKCRHQGSYIMTILITFEVEE